ncbi:hypothetical protein H5T53_04185 [Candidatus Bipolaricaulota bacterium]|nr:hypothetical protein [Candidatus Bipolaricaulota bacterium]
MATVRLGVYSGDPLAVERTLAQRLSALGPHQRVALFGDETCLGKLLDELGTQDLFGETKVVVVRRADALAHEPRLATAVARGLPPGTGLFLIGEKLTGPVTRVAEEVQHFPSPTGRALRELARELLVEAGLPTPAFLVDLLTEASGGDTLRMAQEVAKLALWQGARLPRARLPELLFFSQPPPYAFLDAVGTREIARALAELAKLLRSGWNPVPLFFLLVSHIRSLLAAQAAASAGRKPPGPEWLVRRRLNQARLFGEPMLVRLLGRLQELDLAIKTGRLSPDVALYLFTLDLAPV